MEVITLGESMVLFTPESVGPLRHEQRFCKTIGGAESNVAIALSRLGHKVGWISKLGNDEFGLYIRNLIRGEGVDTSLVEFEDKLSTSVFFKERILNKDPNIYYYRRNSAASTMNPNNIDVSYYNRAKYIHLTGITPAISSSCKDTLLEAIKLTKKNRNQKIVFDPNIRLKLWSEDEAKEVLGDIAKDCDIVMPGIEEGIIMTGERKPEQIAQYFLDRGTELVVVKLGNKGAYFATQDVTDYVPGYEVKNIVDSVGAGDGFAAGLISGLLRGWDYYKSVQLGNKIGAYALSVDGDYEGYPYWEEINPDRHYKKVQR
ncbi:sugar kinase [Virgibacillus sp. CBA3643]|uniref:sugar kinase n=1 Tax=Virgibacillus sp. CBA3643 TaxID=2942278 RepID=UPI0035A2F5AF